MKALGATSIARYQHANDCACANCKPQRCAPRESRMALIEKVAAEMGVAVSTQPGTSKRTLAQFRRYMQKVRWGRRKDVENWHHGTRNAR